MMKKRIPIWNIHFEICQFYLVAELRYAARYPLPVHNFDQYLKAFSWNVWITLFGVLLVFSFTFKIIHYLHSEKLKEKKLIASVTQDPSDFVLLTFAGITEPEVLPWFPKWSSGKLIRKV